MGPLIAAPRPGVSFEARPKVQYAQYILAGVLITSAPSSRRAVGGLSKQANVCRASARVIMDSDEATREGTSWREEPFRDMGRQTAAN